MATVYKWTPFGVALDITATGSNVVRKSATQFTVTINASWETYYNGAATNYGMSATSGGVTSTLSPFGTSASSGSKSFTGTYSISGNGAATKTITVAFKNFNSDNGDSATKNVSFSVSVPAWTSYTIKYNANGGSGAPSSQTKWKGQALTLSSTKPTRTGYSFLGWSTSSTATSATYAAGASYTADAAATLYAVWKANTYTVKYNANGGTGAPGNQTKTYGKALTLSSTKPTRSKYNFLGWGTSASATTATYAAGGSYTTNAAVTLYAVWELAYVSPRITDLVIERCISDGTLSDDGTYAKVTFKWATDETVSSIAIEWKSSSVSTWTSSAVSATGTSGSVTKIIGSGSLDPDISYTVRAKVTDALGSTTLPKMLASAFYTMDFADGGRGAAVGKAAEADGVFDIGFSAKFSGGITPIEIPENTDLNTITTPGLYRCFFNATAKTLANSPTESAFIMEVLPNNSVTQRITEYKKDGYPSTFIRNCYNNEWGSWYERVTRLNKVGAVTNLLTLGAGETYTFPADGYLVVMASYRAGYYVNCTVYGSNHVGFNVTATSGSGSVGMQGNPSTVVYVRKGMYVGNVTTNDTANYNKLTFQTLY
jgi:uncharacterized repeat protein (TIGR02543 family)